MHSKFIGAMYEYLPGAQNDQDENEPHQAMQKRENFAVSLRKKKKQEIINQRRKKMLEKINGRLAKSSFEPHLNSDEVPEYLQTVDGMQNAIRLIETQL